MRNHYSGIKVEKILFGGGGITNELVTAVKKTLGSEVGKLSIKIEGISDDKIQEYLIPLSLQLKDPSEPADESTINLLPPELVKKYTGEKLKGQIWSLTLSVTLVVWVAFFAILGSYMYLSQQINSLRSSSVVLNLPPDKANALDLINKINSAAEKVITIDKFSFSPNVVINMINKVKFEGVSVQRYRIDLEAGKIEIIGIASTRKDLIDFKDALEEYEDFSLVQIPISSLEAESNLEYDMKFIYLPAAPKKKK
jgi:Tfp pilus assembly protein PilN